MRLPHKYTSIYLEVCRQPVTCVMSTLNKSSDSTPLVSQHCMCSDVWVLSRIYNSHSCTWLSQTSKQLKSTAVAQRCYQHLKNQSLVEQKKHCWPFSQCLWISIKLQRAVVDFARNCSIYQLPFTLCGLREQSLVVLFCFFVMFLPGAWSWSGASLSPFDKMKSGGHFFMF